MASDEPRSPRDICSQPSPCINFNLSHSKYSMNPSDYKNEKGQFVKGNPGAGLRKQPGELILSPDGKTDQYGRYLPSELREPKGHAERAFLKKVAVQRAFGPKQTVKVIRMILKLAETAQSEQVRL